MLEGCSLHHDPSSSVDTKTGRPATPRSLDAYFPDGIQPDDLVIYTEAMAVLFRSLVALPGLRRAPGAQGHLKSVPSLTWHGQVGRQAVAEEGRAMYMTGDRTSFWPVPTTMNIIWDAE
jgi:hypothetical protein